MLGTPVPDRYPTYRTLYYTHYTQGVPGWNIGVANAQWVHQVVVWNGGGGMGVETADRGDEWFVLKGRQGSALL